tara:strand:+ start:1653 stop:2294 length:642 start_codon:yes stop_codon:yes gene_type:complete
MDELEFLKKDWKRQEADLPKVSIDSLYKMIHKRSSSIMKWILYISIIEFLFWTILNAFTINTKSLNSLKELHLYEFEIVATFIHYCLLIYFIYIFYKNYKEVQTTENTSILMKRILKVRKTVNYYVIYNLVMAFVIGMIVFIASALYSPKIQKLYIVSEDGSTSLPLTFIITFLAMFLFMIGIFWLFYKLLYGILLRRLQRNYKELNKLELRN